MEAEMSHCCLQAGDPLRASGVVHRPESKRADYGWCRCQSECEGLRIKRAEDRRSMSQLISQAESESNFPPPVCIPPLSGPDDLTHPGEGHLLYSLHQFKCSSLLEAFLLIQK